MKRNFIKLIEKMNENGEPQFKTYITPAFIPFRTMYEATDVKDELEGGELTERQQMDLMLDMVVSIYGNQFTRDQLIDGLHAPETLQALNEQIDWVAQGRMNEERKKELMKYV